MPDDLYTRDVLVWSDQQADLLDRLARGEWVNDAIDWPHVIEELRDVGLSELHACESQLIQALVHLMKIRTWPHGPVPHWRVEAVGFLDGAQRRFVASMRQRLDVAQLYRRALKQVRVMEIDGRGAGDLPAICGLTLDDLLADDADVTALVEKLS